MNMVDRTRRAKLEPSTWIFLGGRWLSNLGEQLLLYAIPLLIFEVTQSVAKSGQAFLIEWLPPVLLLPFLGVLTDRLGEKKVYTTAECCRTLITFACCLYLFWVPVSPFVILTVTAAALSILHAQNYVALETTVARRFTAERLAKMQSLVEGIESVTEVLGPALAALFVVWVSKPYMILCTAPVFFLSAVTVKQLGDNAPQQQVPETTAAPRYQTSVLGDIALGCKAVIARPTLLALCGVSLSLNLLMGVVLATNPAVAKESFQVSDAAFAWLGMTGGLSSAVLMFALPALTCRLGNLNLALVGMILFAGSVSCFMYAAHFMVHVAGFALLNCAIGIFNIHVRIERAKIIPADIFGRTIGFIILINRLGMPLAGGVVAAFGAVANPQDLVGCVGIATLCILVAVLAWKRHLIHRSPILQESTYYEV